MSDFISRQAVMNYLREQQAGIIIEKTKQNAVTYEACKGMESGIDAFMNFINQVPAAYDVDKVVDKIGKIKDHDQFCTSERCHRYRSECKSCEIDGIVKIVKGGGADG